MGAFAEYVRSQLLRGADVGVDSAHAMMHAVFHLSPPARFGAQASSNLPPGPSRL